MEINIEKLSNYELIEFVRKQLSENDRLEDDAIIKNLQDLVKPASVNLPKSTELLNEEFEITEVNQFCTIDSSLLVGGVDDTYGGAWTTMDNSQRSENEFFLKIA